MLSVGLPVPGVFVYFRPRTSQTGALTWRMVKVADVTFSKSCQRRLSELTVTVQET